MSNNNPLTILAPFDALREAILLSSSLPTIRRLHEIVHVIDNLATYLGKPVLVRKCSELIQKYPLPTDEVIAFVDFERLRAVYAGTQNARLKREESSQSAKVSPAPRVSRQRKTTVLQRIMPAVDAACASLGLTGPANQIVHWIQRHQPDVARPYDDEPDTLRRYVSEIIRARGQAEARHDSRR